MKQWAVLSGKGGTGKTTVTAALAHLAAQELPLVMADADVDAANLELVLSPALLEAHDYVGARVAAIDAERCSGCGVCAEACRFGALSAKDGTYRVDSLACEGCAACAYACPAGVITMADRRSGRWFRSQTRFGPLFHARLYAGQENSGKLVTQVRQGARLAAVEGGAELVLIDGPPGIGCPVIAAMTGVDLALAVVEPGVSGVHDLERILATARHFQVPTAVCVNKADINPAQTARVRAICQELEVPLVGTVPFDTTVTEAMVHGRPVTEYRPGVAAEALRALWLELRAGLDGLAGAVGNDAKR